MTTRTFTYNFMGHDFFYYDKTPEQTVDAAQQATCVVKSAGAINLIDKSQDRKFVTRPCYIPDPVNSPIGSTGGLNAVEMRVREAVKWDGVDQTSPGFPLLLNILTYASDHPTTHFNLIFTQPTAKYLKDHPTILAGFDNVHIQSCGTGDDVIRHDTKKTPFGYLASEQYTELEPETKDAEMSDGHESESNEENDADDEEFVPPEHESESSDDGLEGEDDDDENRVEAVSARGSN